MNKVGKLLEEKREEKNLSIDDVVKALKIQKPYLEAIESGDYAFFKNQEFYQQVFVSSYANFLGLDKNTILKDLIEDNKEALNNMAAQPEKTVSVDPSLEEQEKLESDVQEVPVVEIAQTVETEPVVEQTDKSDDVEVEETEEEKVEEPVEDKNEPLEATRPLNSFLEGLRRASRDANENLLADKALEPKTEEVEEEKDNEITQILANLEKNHVSPLAQAKEEKVEVVDGDEQHVDEKLVEDKPAESNLNTSLRDQINLLNESDVQTDDLAQEDVSVPKYDKDSALESTAVIDLTSGIELEKIPDELKATLNQDVNEIKEQDAAGAQYADEISNLKDEKVVGLDDLEKNISTAKDMDLINEDPDKTSMDLKISKALGDSKLVLDETTSKKIKRERIVNGILIALIVILIIVLIYQLVLSR